MTFYEQIYEAVSKIPKGFVATYGQIAAVCGRPRASRAVGNALHVNPYPGVIPCHRVVNHKGHLCNGFAFGGIGRQKEMLEAEGVPVGPDDCVDLSQYRFLF